MEKDFLKITNALYKILDGLSENDPLKNRAKDKALAILENLILLQDVEGWMSLKTYFSPEREKASFQLRSDIETLESYLNIGKSQGWIDNVNFLIITKEYKLIEDTLPKPIPNILVKPSLGIEKQKSEKYSPRQEKILKILETTQKARVADFIKELPKITKRTIRRDLDDLLKKGKIIRLGEWNQVVYQKS